MSSAKKNLSVAGLTFDAAEFAQINFTTIFFCQNFLCRNVPSHSQLFTHGHHKKTFYFSISSSLPFQIKALFYK